MYIKFHKVQSNKMMNVGKYIALLIKISIVQCLFALSASQDFDFFYFVQQWPVSYCDTKNGCCYPLTGRPDEDFGIHGLWPNYNNGSWPEYCDNSNSFAETEISDIIGEMQEEWPTLSCPSNNGSAFWTHEWEKHGTCSESILNQHDYFQNNLDLKEKSNLLQALKNAGIYPSNERLYSLQSIKEAITSGVGYTPFIQCNKDPSGTYQLYQVYLCVGKDSPSEFIECPIFPKGPCGSDIEFPSFYSSNDEL